MGEKHTLNIPGRYEKIQQVCQFVAQGAAEAGLDDSSIFHIEMACDEACTNVIEHAYGGEDVGEIEVSWQIAGNQFVVTIHDHGRAFDPTQIPSPLPSTDPNLTEAEFMNSVRVGGLGIHFMRKLMDDVAFQFDTTGNTLTLRKAILVE
jgi:serine/threonine-protein kinase RsbW